jgi:hypothetical protein
VEIMQVLVEQLQLINKLPIAELYKNFNLLPEIWMARPGRIGCETGHPPATIDGLQFSTL